MAAKFKGLKKFETWVLRGADRAAFTVEVYGGQPSGATYYFRAVCPELELDDTATSVNELRDRVKAVIANATAVAWTDWLYVEVSATRRRALNFGLPRIGLQFEVTAVQLGTRGADKFWRVRDTTYLHTGSPDTGTTAPSPLMHHVTVTTRTLVQDTPEHRDALAKFEALLSRLAGQIQDYTGDALAATLARILADPSALPALGAGTTPST